MGAVEMAEAFDMEAAGELFIHRGKVNDASNKVTRFIGQVQMVLNEMEKSTDPNDPFGPSIQQRALMEMIRIRLDQIQSIQARIRSNIEFWMKQRDRFSINIRVWANKYKKVELAGVGAEIVQNEKMHETIAKINAAVEDVETRNIAVLPIEANVKDLSEIVVRLCGGG